VDKLSALKRTNPAATVSAKSGKSGKAQILGGQQETGRCADLQICPASAWREAERRGAFRGQR